jgi:hypothetical protein
MLKKQKGKLDYAILHSQRFWYSMFPLTSNIICTSCHWSVQSAFQHIKFDVWKRINQQWKWNIIGRIYTFRWGLLTQMYIKIYLVSYPSPYSDNNSYIAKRECGFSHTISRGSWHMCEVNFVVSTIATCIICGVHCDISQLTSWV